ncbi:hypothetical protein PABG_11878 [Paracoccidioides brasiliensis Pb03]|nr:hypothetical protein PABG_11878 [Paracoccidioides brasiliensis Pb03]
MYRCTDNRVIEDIRSNGDSAVRHSTKFDHWEPTPFKPSDDDIQAVIAKSQSRRLKISKSLESMLVHLLRPSEIRLPILKLSFSRGFIWDKKIFRLVQGESMLLPIVFHSIIHSKTVKVSNNKAAAGDYVISCTPPINGKVPKSTVAAINKKATLGDISIDLFAETTEVLIVAGNKADRFTIATDLLSQAEHSPDSPAVIFTTAEDAGKLETRYFRYIDKLLKKFLQQQ